MSLRVPWNSDDDDVVDDGKNRRVSSKTKVHVHVYCEEVTEET